MGNNDRGIKQWLEARSMVEKEGDTWSEWGGGNRAQKSQKRAKKVERGTRKKLLI